ncbi:MAG: hypothetical protein ACQETI_09270 [Halobacteriota archaeon]
MCLGRRVRALLTGTLCLLAAIPLLTTPVAAHGPTTRFEVPIPLSLLFVGAGGTVALTALVLVVGDDWFDGDDGTAANGGASAADGDGVAGGTLLTVPPAVVDVVRPFGRVLFLVLVVAALYDGVAGPQTPGSNFATLFVWPVWLKGLALVAITVGTPWRALAPWRTIHDALSWVEGESVRLRPYPAWLDYWPALGGFVVLLGIVANLTRIPQDPVQTAALVATYALTMVVGGVVFGTEWFERVDPLAVLYRLLGRAAPLGVERTADGGWTLGARRPWAACRASVSSRALAWFAVAAVYTVTFDGFAASPMYQTLWFRTRDLLELGPSVSVLLYLGGLAGFVVAYVVIARLVGSLAAIERPELALAATLVPIAAGYEVAHNYGYVLTFLGRLPTVVGASAVDPLAWLSIPVFWWSQVALVVLGHVVAVVATHGVVERRLGDRHVAEFDGDDSRRAALAHAPMVALMVGYTVLSLWVVSLPVA